MKEQNEMELNTVFDDKSLNKSLKKAKQVTFFRTVIISAIVCILLVFCIYKANVWWIGKKSAEVAAELIIQDTVMKSPNTIINTETVDIGLFKGTIKREVYKVIEDKVILWDTQKVHIGLRGFQSTDFSSYSTEVDDVTQIHFPSGEREMLFYVPQFNYENYANDLSKIKDYPNDKYIEMAISFDQNYLLEEVKSMLPNSVKPSWYWVNDYSMESENREEPESGQWIFGIAEPSSKLGQVLNTPKVSNEADFLNLLKQYNTKDYEWIKDREKDGLIIGVVVTGTKESLSSLEGQPYVKASSLGAIVEKY